MSPTLIAKIKLAVDKDPEMLCERGKETETFGHNPDYLLDIHNITKSDLIRLERRGLAIKARYEVEHKNKRYISKKALEQEKPVCGTHRTRWIIFSEVLG